MMNIEKKIYFAISVADRVGQIARIAALLNNAGVNLLGLWGFGIGRGKAQVIFVPEDPEICRNALKETDWILEEGICFRVTGEDQPGALVTTLDKVAAGGISVDALDSVLVDGSFGCYIWVQQSEIEKTAAILGIA